MITQSKVPTWIRVDAPDARSAFALEQRLAHLHPVTIGMRDRWYVEFEDYDDRVEEIEAAVRHWLVAQDLASTTMRAGNDAQTVVEAPVAVEPLLGAGYDAERVLDHEP
jgi:hypothetical protein